MSEPTGVPHNDDRETVFVLVATLARRASDGQLVLAAATGIAAAVIVGLVRPTLWFIALPLLSLGSFGIWGIAERTSAERSAAAGPAFAGRRALAALRVAAAIIGTGAAALTLLAAAAMAIGTWIS